VRAALAHGWEPVVKGGALPQRETMGPIQKHQTTSDLTAIAEHQYVSGEIGLELFAL